MQGSFSTATMRGWHEEGFLPDDLAVRQGERGSFSALYSIYPDGTTPFTTPTSSMGGGGAKGVLDDASQAILRWELGRNR